MRVRSSAGRSMKRKTCKSLGCLSGKVIALLTFFGSRGSSTREARTRGVASRVFSLTKVPEMLKPFSVASLVSSADMKRPLLRVGAEPIAMLMMCRNQFGSGCG